MRRFLTLVCLLCLAIPAGISVSGCYRNPAGNYCNGLGYGLKDTDVATIFLQPQTTGISLAFGQTQQVASPSAKTCKGQPASVSTYTYGTSNNQLVDVSPTGNLCAGTWNRNTGGGIANYTVCNYPNPLPSTGGLPYATAYITASANSVTSNPVTVYLHPQVTSVTLVGPQACLSQGQLAQLDAQACFSSNNKQQLLCAPSSVSSANYACPLPAGVTSVPNCTAAIGTLNYQVGNAAIASINQETNQITAEQPGTTVITASVAQSGSSAGYFSTCPPKSINVTLANGATTGTVTQGVTQNLTTTVVDTNDNPITGLTLDYQSTDPIDISAGASGAITTNFPSVASIYAICQPPTCNPSPINQTGFNGTGLSISSNSVNVTTPGTASDYVWFSAPGQSQYFVPIELISGTVGSTVRLPYVPNSMVMDRLGTSLYFGSSHELMVFSTANNTLTKQDTNVPGVVLAVSPSNNQLLINDQVRQVFYLYSSSSGTSTTYGGMGNAAAWTPDAKTLYITDSASLNDPPSTLPGQTPLISGHSDTLYIYNDNTGWTTYPLPASPPPPSSLPSLPPNSLPWASLEPNAAVSSTVQTPAITIPSVGAYLRGSPAVAHTWCPTGTVGNNASMVFYPQSDSVTAQADVLAATTDGQHILGAAATNSGVTLTDIGVNIPSTLCPVATNTTTGVQTLSALSTNPTVAATLTLDPTKVNATAVNQLVPSPASKLAFITYTGSTPGAALPYYVPGSNGSAGTVNYVTLNGSSVVTAPLAGAFSPDNTLFFVSTAGDNLIHYISISPTAAPKDTQQIAPNLPACSPGSDPGCIISNTAAPASGIVPATVIIVKPRSTT